MGLFDFFSSKKKVEEQHDEMAWAGVVADLSGTLWTLIQEQPRMLADQYARVLLSDQWHPSIQAGKPRRDDVLSPGDVAFVFLREDEKSLQSWVKSLADINSPVFGQALTQQYAAKLVKKLKERVELI